MRNLLYMFNQRSTKYVLPVFFIGTLFFSFSSTNIFCRPPSLLLTSSTIDNDNNNNYCNSNEFLVSATTPECWPKAYLNPKSLTMVLKLLLYSPNG